MLHKTILFFSLSFAIIAPALAENEVLTLAIGEQRSIPLERNTKFSLGNPEVLSAKPTELATGALLLVKGKSQGYSDLLLLGSTGVQKTLRFRVVTKRQAAVGGDTQSFLSGKTEVRVTANGDGWMAKGKTKDIDEWNSLRVMEAQGKGRFHLMSRLHPLERLKAEVGIQKLFAAAGFSHLAVVGAGNFILLKGNCRSDSEKKLAESLAAQIFQGAVSQLRVPFESGGRVRFRARILEVIKSGAKEVGLDWEQGVPGMLKVGKNFSKADFGLSAALKLLEKRGQAKVLSEPELLLNEKGAAELKVGGEIPIPLRSKYSSGVQWKPYGLLLKLELPGMSDSLARAKILVEITSLDPANGVDGIPGMRVSRMETQVDLSVGRPVLLSGLMDRREARAASLLPGLGDIPILGELFRSNNFQENRSELAILLEANEAEI